MHHHISIPISTQMDFYGAGTRREVKKRCEWNDAAFNSAAGRKYAANIYVMQSIFHFFKRK